MATIEEGTWLRERRRFREARDFLLDHREDYAEAYAQFGWPEFGAFNWALDWFDVIAEGNDSPALWIVEEDGAEQKFSFAEMSAPVRTRWRTGCARRACSAATGSC